MRISKQAAQCAAVAGMVLSLSGCLSPGKDTTPVQVWDDMKFQPKYKPQQSSPMFGDRRASRRPPEGTVAIGQAAVDESYRYGVVSEQYIGRNPETISKALLLHGQTKFNTYCSPCHSRSGDGKGIVALRAGAAFQPTNLLDGRVKEMNDGEIYSVSSEGRRTMMGYRNQTSDYDRWAIVAYVRALHRAVSGSTADIPENLRAQMD